MGQRPPKPRPKVLDRVTKWLNEAANAGGYTHTNPPPKTRPPTSYAAWQNRVGAKPPTKRVRSTSWPLPPVGSYQTNPFDNKTDFFHCDYCGQSNSVEREGCRMCGAPRPEEPTARARKEPVVHPINPGAGCYTEEETYKGVLLSRLSGVELREAERHFRELYSGPQLRPAILPLDLGGRK